MKTGTHKKILDTALIPFVNTQINGTQSVKYNCVRDWNNFRNNFPHMDTESLILQQMLTSQKSMKIVFLKKTQKVLYLGFKFCLCVLKQVTQGLKSEFCKNLGEKSDFDVKVTFCYFCIPS